VSGRRPSAEAFDRTTPVLILKTRSLRLHHGTLGVIRSLGRVGVPVYSLNEPGVVPAARSRYLTGDTLGVLSASDPEASITALRAFQRRVGRPVLLLPVDDAGAMFVAEHAGALLPEFLLPAQQHDLPRMVASKANNPQLCASLGVATPQTRVLGASDDLSTLRPAIRFPAVAKIAQPWLRPDGVRAAALVRNALSLAEYRAELRARTNADVVVQEYIPEEGAEDWFYHGYHREGGEPVVGFTGRKLRSYPPFFGPTTYGVSSVNEEVLTISRKMLRALGYAGVVELEFRLDRRDGRYKFLDFNPRLGAQFQFLRNDRWIDVVRAMHLDLTGRPVPTGPQLEGLRFVSDFKDLAAFGAYSRSQAVGPLAWLGQLIGAQEHAWFALDDPAPFVAAFGESARRFRAAAMRRRRQPRPGGEPARPRQAHASGRPAEWGLGLSDQPQAPGPDL
jgi:predicted ATP-grasp superfamily ATP-dependent carboligase